MADVEAVKNGSEVNGEENAVSGPLTAEEAKKEALRQGESATVNREHILLGSSLY